MRRTIFYSYKIHGKLLLENIHKSYDQILSFMEIKSKIINLLSDHGYLLREIIRPEIYKHQISFNFLPNFNAGDIHLIFKPMEFIRPLKNAYNIWIKTQPIKILEGPSIHPFLEFRRMQLLIEEIWNCFPDNNLFFLPLSKKLTIINILNEKDLSSISFDVILKRIKTILGE